MTEHTPEAGSDLPYDPTEWEERLAEARERRAIVLEKRIREARNGTVGETTASATLNIPAEFDLRPELRQSSRPVLQPSPLQRAGESHPRQMARWRWHDRARARHGSKVGHAALAGAFCLGLAFAVPLAFALMTALPPDRLTLAGPLDLEDADLRGSVPVPDQPAQTASLDSESPVSSDMSPDRGEPTSLEPEAREDALQHPRSAEAQDSMAQLFAETEATVVMHRPNGTSSAAANAKTAALQNAGFTRVQQATTPFTIRETQVRYYHAEDAVKAMVIAQATDARLRDFTSYTPAPEKGLVEVWLAGRADRTFVAQSRTDRNSLALPAELRPSEVAKSIGSAFSDLIQSFPQGNER